MEHQLLPAWWLSHYIFDALFCLRFEDGACVMFISGHVSGANAFLGSSKQGIYPPKNDHFTRELLVFGVPNFGTYPYSLGFRDDFSFGLISVRRMCNRYLLVG